MAEPETSKTRRAGGENSCADLNEFHLRAEIDFWREMITSRSDALPPDAVERMHHALALAQSRLSGLPGQAHRPSFGNVIPLERARRKAS